MAPEFNPVTFSRQFVMTEAPENLLEHCAVKAWSQLGPRRIEPASLDVIKIVKTSAVYRLADVGPNGSNVIAKKYPATAAAAERTVYEELLTRVPFPALRTYGWVKEPKEDHCWLFLEEPGGMQYSPLSDEHRALAGRWLGTIHSAAMRLDLAGRLPRREPSHYLRLLRISRSKARELLAHPAMTEGDLKTLTRIVSHCDVLESHWDLLEEMCCDLRQTVVHGDFAAKNVRVKMTRAGPAFLVLDWGIAGWGIPATDLAQFIGHTVSPDFGEYCSAMERCGTPMDRRTVERLAVCGKIFRLLDAISWACSWEVGDSYSHLKKPISLLGRYATRLTEAFRAAWGIEPGTSAISSRMVDETRVREVLRRIVNQLMPDSTLKEDLMQEGLVRLWKLEVEQPGRTRSWYLQNCKFHLQHWLELGRSVDSRKRVTADKRITLDEVDDALPCAAADKLFDVVSARDIVSTLAGHLDPCENAVVGGLADGLRLQEIAVKLNLSYPTVLKYRRKIAALTIKLGISTPCRPIRSRNAAGSEHLRASGHAGADGCQTGTRSHAHRHC